MKKEIEWIFTENSLARLMRDMRDTTLDLSRIVGGLSTNYVPHHKEIMGSAIPIPNNQVFGEYEQKCKSTDHH